MIRSWRNTASRRIWEGARPNQFRRLDFDRTVDLLLALNVAATLQDLSPLKSVGLHKLKGERKNQWAMTVNGRPRWTCRTKASTVAKDGRIEIGPLANLPVIKDLATDMTRFFEKWQAAQGRFAPSRTRNVRCST